MRRSFHGHGARSEDRLEHLRVRPLVIFVRRVERSVRRPQVRRARVCAPDVAVGIQRRVRTVQIRTSPGACVGDAWGEGCDEEGHLWAPESRWGLFGFARGVEAVLGGVDSPMGEELGVGGVQVRVPSRRRIALTSGRCHQTRAAGACAPRFGGKSRVCSRFEQQYRILQSSRRSRGTSVASTGRITRIAMVTPHAYPAPASLTSRAAHAGASSPRRRRVPIARRKLATHGSPSGNGIARGRRRFEAVAHEHLDWSSIERTHAREESGLWLPGSRGWTLGRGRRRRPVA